MSDYDPHAFASPTPPPMSVVPVTYQPPVDPYGYSGRPGLITTIGVFCFIVAGTSILIGGLMGLINFSLASTSKFKAFQAGQPQVQVAAKVVPKSPEYIPADGMSAADRPVALDAINTVRQLSPGQIAQFNELLAIDGAKLFPTFGQPMDAQKVTAAISGSGPFGSGDDKGAYFITGDGKIDVSENRAVFIPTEGDSLVVTAPQVPAVSAGAATPPFTDDQIRSVIRCISVYSANHRLPAEQTKSLVGLLRRPGQQFIVPPTDNSDPAWEISSASVNPDGSLDVKTEFNGNTSNVTLNPSGQIVNSSTVPTASTKQVMPKINRNAALLTGWLTAFNLFLAIYLIVVGIFFLRTGFRGWWMAWIFVILKLPVTIGAALAGIWMWNSLIESLASGPNGVGQGLETTKIVFITPPLLGAIFPIVLAILLVLPPVRRYFTPKIG